MLVISEEDAVLEGIVLDGSVDVFEGVVLDVSIDVFEGVVLDVSVDVFELDELGGVELEGFGSVACGVLLL